MHGLIKRKSVIVYVLVLLMLNFCVTHIQAASLQVCLTDITIPPNRNYYSITNATEFRFDCEGEVYNPSDETIVIQSPCVHLIEVHGNITQINTNYTMGILEYGCFYNPTKYSFHSGVNSFDTVLIVWMGEGDFPKLPDVNITLWVEFISLNGNQIQTFYSYILIRSNDYTIIYDGINTTVNLEESLGFTSIHLLLVNVPLIFIILKKRKQNKTAEVS